MCVCVLPQEWGKLRQQSFQMLWWDLNCEQIPQTSSKFHRWAAAQIYSLMSRLQRVGPASCKHTGVHRDDSWVYRNSGSALHPEQTKYGSRLHQCLAGLGPASFCSNPLQKERCWFLPQPAALRKNGGSVLSPSKVRLSSNRIASFNISPDLQGGDILPFGTEQLLNFQNALTTP